MSDVARGGEPIVNAPAVVVALIVAMLAIHLMIGFLPIDQQDRLIVSLAFIPMRYGAEGMAVPGDGWASIVSPVTHMLLHANWLHVGFNSAWLLAMGSIVARRMSVARFLVYFVVCGLSGAALFAVVNANVFAPMIGASGAISGLMGGVFRFMFNVSALQTIPRERLPGPSVLPRMTLREALSHRMVLTALGLWIGINAIFATDVGRMLADGEVAWEAHLGGFFAGFLLFGLFDQIPTEPLWSRTLGRMFAEEADDDADDERS